MAIKKSDLYASLWASCDELRGGMDASQYKDYVLFMLFIKYISDKYGNSDDFAPPVIIPKGASFPSLVRRELSDRMGADFRCDRFEEVPLRDDSAAFAPRSEEQSPCRCW